MSYGFAEGDVSVNLDGGSHFYERERPPLKIQQIGPRCDAHGPAAASTAHADAPGDSGRPRSRLRTAAPPTPSPWLPSFRPSSPRSIRKRAARTGSQLRHRTARSVWQSWVSRLKFQRVTGMRRIPVNGNPAWRVDAGCPVTASRLATRWRAWRISWLPRRPLRGCFASPRTPARRSSAASHIAHWSW